MLRKAHLRERVSGLRLSARYNDFSMPRLGIMVPKRQIRLASERNRVKRLIRESFRASVPRHLSVDIVVGANKSVVVQTNDEVFRQLANLWLLMEGQLCEDR